METMRVIYTRRRWNLVSLFIRWTLPRSRFVLAKSSHALVIDGDHVIEAGMLTGVRRVLYASAMHGQTIVEVRDYRVANAERGLAWYRAQVCTYVADVPSWLPKVFHGVYQSVMLLFHNNYDWGGILGLGIAPGRDWQSPDSWFCYEAAAAALVQAGRDDFADTGHITETALLAIKP